MKRWKGEQLNRFFLLPVYRHRVKSILQWIIGWVSRAVCHIVQSPWTVHCPSILPSMFFPMPKIISSKAWTNRILHGKTNRAFLRPYYGLLLVIDPSALLASLPTDSSSTLSTLVQCLRPSYSMSRLSIETGVPLTQVRHSSLSSPPNGIDVFL